MLEKEPKRNIEDYPENDAKEIAKDVFSKALPRFANLIHRDQAYDLSADLAFIQGAQPRIESCIQYIWGRPLTTHLRQIQTKNASGKSHAFLRSVLHPLCTD